MTESHVLYERFLAAFLAASFALLAYRIAWRNGYFFLIEDLPLNPSIPFAKAAIQAFGIFLFIQVILSPTLYTLWAWQSSSDSSTLVSAQFQGWWNLGTIGLTIIVLGRYFKSLDQSARNAIWGQKKSLKQNVIDFCMGSVTWLIVYPWILVIGQLLSILLALVYTGPLPDQAAVKHLKSILTYPWLFGLTVFAVVSLIPFLEELLFRGFLQTLFKSRFGVKHAIWLTSLIFASFHFSVSQGIENIEFITSLFVLSCFLGFIKERQQSLWASVGLHSTFNFISVCMLLSQ